MDNKTVALVGALLVLGVAVYGMATGNLPGFEQLGDEEQAPNNANNIGDGTSDDGNTEPAEEVSNNETEQESERDERIDELSANTGFNEDQLQEMDNERLNELLRRTRLGEVCENQGEEVELDPSYVPIRAGPPFNPLLLESMVHDELNELRITHSDGEPFRCDPKLRGIARNHSKDIIMSNEINATSVRYNGVCENPTENYGTWYYQRDMELDPPGGGSDQSTNMIEDHEEFVSDVRRVWFNDGSVMNSITDESATRQGLGAHINRETRRVVVTHVTC